MRPRSSHLSRLLWSLAAGAVLSSLLALLGPLLPRIGGDEMRSDWAVRTRSWLTTVHHNESTRPMTPSAEEITNLRARPYRTNGVHPIILGFMDYAAGGEFILVESGWPLRSLMGWAHATETAVWPDTSSGNLPPPKLTSLPTTWTHESHGLIPVGTGRTRRSGTGTGLPYGPLWTGLVTNTLAWGAAIFAILTLAATTLAAARRLHGRCDRCAYDLQHTPCGQPCPECGAPHA